MVACWAVQSFAFLNFLIYFLGLCDCKNLQGAKFGRFLQTHTSILVKISLRAMTCCARLQRKKVGNLLVGWMFRTTMMF